MAEGTAILNPESNAVVDIKITFTGLIHAKFTSRLFRFSSELKKESGEFPDDKPDTFTLLGVEKDNIHRRFEIDLTLGAIDPINFPNWKVTCEVSRRGFTDPPLLVVSEEGSFQGGNITDPNVTIYFNKL